MKAPDKIYLSVDKNEDWKYAMWTTKSPQEQKFSELDKHEEYIRKDALLEWAERHNCEQGFEDGETEHGYRVAIRDLVSKLNSM